MRPAAQAAWTHSGRKPIRFKMANWSCTVRISATLPSSKCGTEPDTPGLARPELVRVLELARQLADPKPADARTIGQLGRYKGLDARWTDWGNVTDVCRSLAVEMVQ
jgi:hypothetical protein